jgi:hypothetical protein
VFVNRRLTVAAAAALVTLASCAPDRLPTSASETARRGLTLPVATPADAATFVRINEVESNLGTPGDWVELRNSGDTPIDLTGFVFRDNDGSRGYTLPTGTIIPAGGFLVLEEAQFGFGLGAGDQARLFAPDGTTLIDSYEWTAHATITWGRCPDGTGAWQATTLSTKGAANECGVLPRLNEIESEGGTPGDWVEVVNPGTAPLDLSGHVLRGAADAPSYTIPAGTILAPGAWLVIEEAQLGFGFGAVDAARLFRPGGTVLVDSHAWTAHAPTSWGRCPDTQGGFVATTAPTKGAANACAAVTTAVKVNEVESNGGVPGDWVEFVNTSAQPVDLSGYVFRDNVDGPGYVLPSGTVIPANGFLVLDEAQFGFGLGAADAARLFGPGGVTLVDSYSWTVHATTSYGRCPDGTGTFTTTTTVTKGAANDCRTLVVINEVESSGGTPGDWVELFNAGPAPADVSGWVFRDNNDQAGYAIPAGTIIAAGGYLVLDEAQFGFGLGAADAARLFRPDGTTLVDSYTWTVHATTTYGRCPNGSGPFTTTASATKGAINDCGTPALTVRINEVESSGGTPGDWVELINTGPSAVDLTGWVFRDNADGAGYVLPPGSTIAAGGYLVLEEAQFGFGLGGGDAARLFAPGGVQLIDSYVWTTHAATTYGRCPNGTGDFTTTTEPTKGALNRCPGDIVVGAWPGGTDIFTADLGGVFGGNLSGLAIQPVAGRAVGTLWAVRNGPGALFRLDLNGTVWAFGSRTWPGARLLRYPDGTGDVDAEGLTIVGTSAFVAAERNNLVSGTSRNSVLRFELTGATGSALVAAREWNLTADLPVTGANLGLEAITHIPDAWLVARGFIDERTGQPYDPATYPGHGSGLFFVGVEANGQVYAYALNQGDGTFARVATIASGWPAVMDLSFDEELGQLWTVCDNTCNGRTAVLRIDERVGSPTRGRFVVGPRFERPAGMPNLNNEGFTFAGLSACSGGVRPVFWADDGETGGFAIRRGTLTCAPFPAANAPVMAGR